MKHTETYTSCMHVHVRFYVYEPEVVLRIKGVVQVHHGLGEHADRYEHFASFLLGQGFVVVVSDFVGHGKSLIDFEQGYFGLENGPDNLVKDMQHLVEIMRLRYPDVPYFMLGGDLGSILIRKYMSVYGDYIDGVLLLGTPAGVEHRYLKKMYLYMMKNWHGPLYKTNGYFRSFLNQNNRKLRSKISDIDWMTSDDTEKMKFLNDSMTHFSYTVQGYRDIVHCIQEVNKDDVIKKTPRHIAIYIGVGEYDSMVRGIEKLVEKYKNVPVYDVTFEVFENRRHAILFEKDKIKVYLSLLKWLNDRTYL